MNDGIVYPDTKLSDLLKGPKRLAGETFEDFKRRRTLEAALTKRILRGRLVWDPNKHGPYRGGS